MVRDEPKGPHSIINIFKKFVKTTFNSSSIGFPHILNKKYHPSLNQLEEKVCLKIYHSFSKSFHFSYIPRPLSQRSIPKSPRFLKL